jgi:hypothetical protein
MRGSAWTVGKGLYLWNLNRSSPFIQSFTQPYSCALVNLELSERSCTQKQGPEPSWVGAGISSGQWQHSHCCDREKPSAQAKQHDRDEERV